MITTRYLLISAVTTWLTACATLAAEPKETQPAPTPSAAQASEKQEPAAGRIEVKDGAAAKKTPAQADPAVKAEKPTAVKEKRAEHIVEFDQTPASQVIDFVAERAKVNIVFDPAVAEKLKTPITFKTRNMTCRQVLDWAVKLSGTAWVLADGAVFVTSQDNVPKVDVTEEVRKFIAEHPKFAEPPPDFPAPPEMEMGFPGVK
jgi:hypothetical protein